MKYHKNILVISIVFLIVFNINAQVKQKKFFWDFNDSAQLIPKSRLFHTILPVSNPIIPNGSLVIAQSLVLDQYIKHSLKFTFEWNYKLVAMENKFSLFKFGTTFFPIKKVIKKEFPVMFETNYTSNGKGEGVYTYKMSYIPINLMQKHGFNIMFGRYNITSQYVFHKISDIYIPDSNKTYLVSTTLNYKHQNYLMFGYKYERSRCYQYRTNENKKKEKNFIKKVFTNSQIGLDFVKNISKYDHNDIYVNIRETTKENNASDFPKEQYGFVFDNYITKKLNRLGYRFYWEKEISYWYQKNWGFRFGCEIFKGTYKLKGSGYVMLRFGGFVYLNKSKHKERSL